MLQRVVRKYNPTLLFLQIVEKFVKFEISKLRQLNVDFTFFKSAVDLVYFKEIFFHVKRAIPN